MGNRRFGIFCSELRSRFITGVLSVMCVSRVATCVSVISLRTFSPETLLVVVTFKCIGCREYCVFKLNRLEMNKSLFPK